MAQGSAMGLYTQGGGGSTTDNALIATVPANAVLTKIDVTGAIVSESVAQTVAASTFATFNLMTGLQWVSSGGTPATINTTVISSGDWLRFAEGLPITQTPLEYLQSTTYVLYNVFGLIENWRGLFYVPFAIDIYQSYGEDLTRGDTFDAKMYFTYYVEWATFP